MVNKCGVKTLFLDHFSVHFGYQLGMTSSRKGSLEVPSGQRNRAASGHPHNVCEGAYSDPEFSAESITLISCSLSLQISVLLDLLVRVWKK